MKKKPSKEKKSVFAHNAAELEAKCWGDYGIVDVEWRQIDNRPSIQSDRLIPVTFRGRSESPVGYSRTSPEESSRLQLDLTPARVLEASPRAIISWPLSQHRNRLETITKHFGAPKIVSPAICGDNEIDEFLGRKTRPTINWLSTSRGRPFEKLCIISGIYRLAICPPSTHHSVETQISPKFFCSKILKAIGGCGIDETGPMQQPSATVIIFNYFRWLFSIRKNEAEKNRSKIVFSSFNCRLIW